MASNLSFEQINQASTNPIFTQNGSEVLLNVNNLLRESQITPSSEITINSLSEEKIVELAYAFLYQCFVVQENANETIPTGENKLRSFSESTGTLFTDEATGKQYLIKRIEVSGSVPLDIENIQGIVN